jgi:glucosamine--fructose-6-phosphate aminotransferase (isomerizing)
MMTLKETHLFREIHEQPAVLQRFLDSQQKAVQELAAAIRVQGITQVVIAARGTSDNAGRYAKYMLGARNKLTVALATPSLFSIYDSPPHFDRALVLGISQSGKSPDIVSVLAEARKQGVLTAAITNNPDSDLAQQADIVIELMAGQEQAVAATKTYIAQLAAIALLSATLAEDVTMKTALAHMPENVAATLGMNERVAACAPRYRYMHHAVVIGRGYNYATAFEMALKLKELTYAIVEPYSSADFLHGPLAVLEPGFPVVVVGPSGRMQTEIGRFMHTLVNHKAEIIAISDVPNLLEMARIKLALPVSVPEWLSPLTAIVPGQLLAMHLAHTRDYNVDAPRGIRKITETI